MDNPAVATPECVVEVMCVVDFDCIVDPGGCGGTVVDKDGIISVGQSCASGIPGTLCFLGCLDNEGGAGLIDLGEIGCNAPNSDPVVAAVCNPTSEAPTAPAADAGPSAENPDVTSAATPGSDEPAIVTPVAPAPADTPDVVEIGCSGGHTLIDGICQTPPPDAPATIAGANVDTPGDDNPNIIAPVSPNGSDDGALPTIDAPPIATTTTCGAGEVLVGNTCLVDPIDNPQLINPGQLPPVGGGDTIAEIATNEVIASGVLLAPIGGGAFDIDPIAP